MVKIILALVVAAVMLTVPVTSDAGGLFLTELGTEDVALAGAGWAARAQDASTLFKNPAGMSRLQGNQFQGGLQGLYFQGKFNPSVASQGGGDGGNPVGALPAASGFYVHSLSKDLKVGLGVFSNFGSGLKYDDDWAGRYYVRESALMSATLAPVASYRVNEWISIGGGPNIMAGYLKYTAAVNNSGPGDGQLKVKDMTVGVGGQFGVLFEPHKGTRFGVTYYSPIKLDFSDNLSLSGVSDTPFGSLRNASLSLGMTVPQHVIASAYHELTDRFAIMGNLGWENWNRFGKVDVNLVSSDTSISTTAAIPFQDTYHVAIGSQYRLNQDWLLNSGFAFDTSMVKDQDRSLSLPVGAVYKFGMGAQWQFSPTTRLGFSYGLAYIGDLPVSQNRGPLAGEVTGQFPTTIMHFLAVTLNWGSRGVQIGPGR